MKIAVSGIPRGYQFPGADGNWLLDKHRAQILAAAPGAQLVEIPAHQVAEVADIEVLLAEGGNRVHYHGELDWEDYGKFFTPSLRWVQLCSAGFSDNLTPEIVAGTVVLTNAPGVHTRAIAESVLAAILSHAKHLPQRLANQQQHAWTTLANDELYGRTALILGLGQLGQAVAQLCKAFGMRVIGARRSRVHAPYVDELFDTGSLQHKLPEADYVVLTLPHTPATANLLDASAFRAMKPSAYLINVGRGATVNEADLLRALRERWIAGAYLDVFVTEPLPPDHPLWVLPSVTIVPHDSHSSPYIGDRLVNLFCDNLQRYIAQQPLRHRCDPAKGY